MNRAVYRYRNFIGNHMIRFTVWHKQSICFPASSAHFGKPFAYFRFWIPRNKPNKDSTEILVRKASGWSCRCRRGIGNIYMSTGFLSAFSVWKSQPQLYWIFNCDFWFDPCALLPTRYRKRTKTILFWYMQWHQEVIAELIALYFINFHSVERKFWEYELSGYFFFWLSIHVFVRIFKLK